MKGIFMSLFVLPFFLLVAGTMYADEPTKVAAPVAVAAPVVTVQPTSEPAIDLPPAWLENALNFARRIPWVGPVVVEFTKWAGLFGGVMTLLVTTILGLLRILVPALNIAGLAAFALKVQIFENSPLMYWIKFFSMYNAVKKQPEEKKG